MPRAQGSAWTPRRAALVGLAALAVTPAPGDRVARALARARGAGLPARAALELGLMLRLYAGFPAAIEFLRRAARTWPPRKTGGVPASYDAWPGWQRRGERLCRRVYGPEYARLRAFMQGLHPDLDHWMILEGYGKTLARPGLTVVERELATVAALTALGWTRQAAAHARGAIRVGAPAEHVTRALRAGVRCRASLRAAGAR